MSSIFIDSFDRLNNTDISAKAPMGVSYTEVTDDFQIVSGKLKAINLATHRATVGLTMNSADYYTQAKVFTDPSFTSGIGLMLRYQDASNYYYARINTFDQTLKITKRVAGSETELGNFNGGYVGNATYTLKFEITGTTLKAYVDGVLRITVTDSAISAAGKPGLWTDYGNSTFDEFVVSGDFTITAPTITADYDQPALPARNRGWRFNSIDLQIVTKSENWNQDQTKRLNEYQAVKDLGITHAAIAVPFNNLTKYTNYVTDARTKGLKLYHRSHWPSWEGDSPFPAGLSRQDYLTGIYHFIVDNPTLFEDGDLWGTCVECSNANDHGNYTFRTPETSGGSFSFSKYNQFLKDQVAYANAAFAVIGKSVYTFPVSFSLSLLNLNGQILDSGDGGNSSGLSNDDIVQYFGGILTIDHYMSDAYRDDDNYAAKFSSDLDKIHAAFPDCRIFIGEWGYHTVAAVNDAEQDTVYREVINVMLSKRYIIGVNFWVHMGSNTASLFTDTGGTINLPGRPATERVQTAFNLLPYTDKYTTQNTEYHDKYIAS